MFCFVGAMVACHFAYLRGRSAMAILIARWGEREHLVLDPFHPFDNFNQPQVSQSNLQPSLLPFHDTDNLLTVNKRIPVMKVNRFVNGGSVKMELGRSIYF